METIKSVIKIIVSDCLMGTPCRWHGKDLRMSSYVKKYIAANPDVELIPVCPEMLGGLPVPRPPVKRRKGRVFETCEEKSNRKNVTGKNITDSFQLGAQKTLDLANTNIYLLNFSKSFLIYLSQPYLSSAFSTLPRNNAQSIVLASG